MNRSRRAWKGALALAAAVTMLAASCSSGSDSSGGSSSASTEAPAASALPAGAQEASLLYDFRAAGGTWTPLSEGSPVHVLELTGVSPTATWFTDRPVRQAGTVPVNTALTMIGVAPDDVAPNAVIDVHEGDETSNIVAVKLEAPAYDPNAATLRFLATPLPSVQSAGLAGYQDGIDPSLPPSFGPVSMFIDDADTVVGQDGRPVDPAQLGNYDWQYEVINLKGSAPFRVKVKAGPNGHANCVGAATDYEGTYSNGGYFTIGFSVNSSGICALESSWQEFATNIEVLEGSNPTGWDAGAKGSTTLKFTYFRQVWTLDCSQAAIPLSGGQAGQAGSLSCVGGEAGFGTITG